MPPTTTYHGMRKLHLFLMINNAIYFLFLFFLFDQIITQKLVINGPNRTNCKVNAKEWS